MITTIILLIVGSGVAYLYRNELQDYIQSWFDYDDDDVAHA